MRNFEAAGLCSLEEYKAGERERLQASDLHVEELYMVLFALASKTHQRSAAKFAARIQKTTPLPDSDMYAVNVMLHDQDLQPCLGTVSIVEDGYWMNVKDQVVIEKMNTKMAYFKGYADDIDNELQVITQTLKVPTIA